MNEAFCFRVHTQGSFGSGARDTRVDNRREERQRRHDRVAALRERNRRERERAERALQMRRVLEKRVFDRQPQEVQDALVLRAGRHVLRDAVPVVAVSLDALKQTQSLLVGPVARARTARGTTRLAKANRSDTVESCRSGRGIRSLYLLCRRSILVSRLSASLYRSPDIEFNDSLWFGVSKTNTNQKMRLRERISED